MPIVVVIDVQKDYLDERGIGSIGKVLCVPGVRRLLLLARRRGWTIAHVGTRHESVATLPRRLREVPEPKLYCVTGGSGAEFLGGLVRDTDAQHYKSGFSAFDGTTLETFLGDAEDVVVAGVSTDCCLLQTVFDAGTRFGRRVFLPYEAVSATDVNAYMFGVAAMAKSVARVVSLETLEGHGMTSLASVPQLDASSWRDRWRTWYEQCYTIAAQVHEEYATLLETEGVDSAVAAIERALSHE